jgi:hypothetical protein
MPNVVVNTDEIVTRYATKVVAQSEKLEVLRPLIGGESDANACCFRPGDEHKNGKIWNIPLRKAVTTAALEDGATYEGQGQKSILSTTQITANERGQVFGGFDTFEELQTVVPLRETHAQEAGSWAAYDFDYKGISQLLLATTSLPVKTARTASQYNVWYCGTAQGWGSVQAGDLISPTEISKCKRYMAGYRGIRPLQIASGRFGYIMIIPNEATLELQLHGDYHKALADVLPRDEDHIFFRGHGLNPWGYWDGVYLVEDMRPVYGGSDATFLTTAAIDEGNYIKYEGLFLGAQAFSFAEWKDMTWYERIWDHNRKFEVSVNSVIGFAKNVINLGTLASPSNRDYGLGYFVGAAKAINV